MFEIRKVIWHSKRITVNINLCLELSKWLIGIAWSSSREVRPCYLTFHLLCFTLIFWRHETGIF